tara:strand:- start:15 stop:227 length:213 start_codon:yes stop_codon:yes gene_type:complete
MQTELPGPNTVSSFISPFEPFFCDGTSFEPGHIVSRPESSPSIPMSVHSSSFAGPPLSRTFVLNSSFVLP